MQGPKLSLVASCESCEFVHCKDEHLLCLHQQAADNSYLPTSQVTPEWCPLLTEATRQFGRTLIPNPFMLEINFSRPCPDAKTITRITDTKCVLDGGDDFNRVYGFRFPNEFESQQAGERVVEKFSSAKFKVSRI